MSGNEKRSKSLELLEQITVQSQDGSPKTIELYHGDLTDSLPHEEAADFLVVSAFPDNYVPSYSSLVGSLKHKLDVSLQDLAAHKFLDLRVTSSCWVSHPIKGKPFKQIVCFEPTHVETAPEVVGDIFRSLVPLTSGPTKILMPVVAAGNRGIEPENILPNLLDAALHWISFGLSLQELRIVECRAERAKTYARIFREWKNRNFPPLNPVPTYEYDVFISYCHADKEWADLLVGELRKQKSDIRIFMDRLVLNPGVSWQLKIFQALDACHRIVTLYSPAYLASKMCAEELNIALIRHRNANHPVLIPLFVKHTPLPTYLQSLHYANCLEENGSLQSGLQEACRCILASIMGL